MADIVPDVIRNGIELLCKVYPKVQTLEDFVKDISDNNELQFNLEFTEYLKRSLIGFHTTAPHNLKAFASNRHDYEAVLGRAIRACWHSKEDRTTYLEPNILCQYGCHWYRSIYTRTIQFLERKNEVADYFDSELVKELYTIIGRDCFTYLLTKCSLFECLTSSVCFQRSGIPVDAMLSYVLKTQNENVKCKSKKKKRLFEEQLDVRCKKIKCTASEATLKKMPKKDFEHMLQSCDEFGLPNDDFPDLDDRTEEIVSSNNELDLDTIDFIKPLRINVDDFVHVFLTSECNAISTNDDNVQFYLGIDYLSSSSDSDKDGVLKKSGRTYCKSENTGSITDVSSTSTAMEKLSTKTVETAKEAIVSSHAPVSSSPSISSHNMVTFMQSSIGQANEKLTSCSSEQERIKRTKNVSTSSVWSDAGSPSVPPRQCVFVPGDNNQNVFVPNGKTNESASSLSTSRSELSVLLLQADANKSKRSRPIDDAKVETKRMKCGKSGSTNGNHEEGSMPIIGTPYASINKTNLSSDGATKGCALSSSNVPYSLPSEISTYNASVSLKTGASQRNKQNVSRTKLQKRQKRASNKYCSRKGRCSVPLQRSVILHSADLHEMPSKDFLMMKLPYGEEGIDKLYSEIFEKGRVKPCCPMTERQKSHFYPLLNRLVRQFHLVFWANKSAIDAYCPLPQGFDTMNAKELLNQHCTHIAVCNFFSDFLRKLVPGELFGSVTNFEVALMELKDLIFREDSETLWLQTFASKLKISEIKWLTSTKCCKVQLWQLIFFFIETAFQIIEAFFYVTENASNKRKLLFYRKPVWCRINSLGIEDLQNSDIITRDARNPSAFTGWFHYRTRSVSDASLQPKTAPFKLKADHVFLSMKAIIACQILRSRLTDVNQVSKCLRALHTYRKHHKDTRPLYYVKASLMNCYYACTFQEKLLKTYQEFLNELNVSSYRIIRTAVIQLEPLARLRTQYLCQAVPKGESRLGVIRQINSKMSIVAIQRDLGELTSDMQYSAVKRYVKRCLIEGEHLLYRVAGGIGQGSILPQFLCDFYLEALMRKHFADFGNVQDEKLIRFFHDFLYVTPYLEKAKQFTSVMKAAFDDFGCMVHLKKTTTSFRNGHTNYLTEGEPVKYIGLIVNRKHLNVSVDYSTYSEASLKYVRSLRRQNPKIIRENLLHFVTNTPCIILDMEINPKKNVLKNLFERFLFVACLLHRIFTFQFLLAPDQYFSQMFVRHLIVDVADAMNKRIQSIKEQHISCEMVCYEVEFMCIKAFLHVIQSDPLFYCTMEKVILELKLDCEKRLSKKKVSRLCSIIKHKNVHLNKILWN